MPPLRPADKLPHAHELSHGPALPGHGCRLGRAGQAPDHDDGRVHRPRRLRHRVDGLAVDPRPGHRARRDRPRRRGRQRSQPGDGAGHGRPHAAHADAPHPVRRIPPGEARTFGALLTATGLVVLLWLCGPLAAAVALATWASYLFAYTPLKRRTPLATLVGAVPGALPPVIGWAAARGRLDAGAFILFAILFLWQIPHFLAIAWLYRDDYARAGFPMLPVLDREGTFAGRQAVVHSLALLLVSWRPSWPASPARPTSPGRFSWAWR